MQWINDLTDFIFLKDIPQQADIIFVPRNSHCEPADHAAELFRAGYAPRILPSGRYSIRIGHFSGQSSPHHYDGDFETEWAFMHEVLVKNGVPPEAILREDQATFTYQNALLSRQVTDDLQLSIKKAILVCIPVHARRAKMYYETAFPEASILVCPSLADITRENWTKSENGIHTVLDEVSRVGNQFHDILCSAMNIDATKSYVIP